MRNSSRIAALIYHHTGISADQFPEQYAEIHAAVMAILDEQVMPGQFDNADDLFRAMGTDCTEPDRASCPRLCGDFCNEAEIRAMRRERPEALIGNDMALLDWSQAVQQRLIAQVGELEDGPGQLMAEAACLLKLLTTQWKNCQT